MKENHARPGRRSILTVKRASDGSNRDLDLKAKRRYDKEGHESVLKIREYSVPVREFEYLG
ncbi:MAG: hypothetical protein ACYDHX_07705 [Methanothrix sp.]